MEDQAKESYRPPPRREFFKYLVNGIAAAIVAILGFPLVGFYALPALRKREPVWKAAGPVDDFPVGEIKLAVLRPLKRLQWPEDWRQDAAWVYRKSGDAFVLYDIHCTHVGCPVNWSPQAGRFFCPCHGAAFDPDGRVIAGPPPRPLDRFEVRVADGMVYAGPVRRADDNRKRAG
jgi:menaquinol-cytochrome c reductase iron-sulfur subunit